MSLMVKSGGVKGLPYVSRSPAYSSLPASTSREESDEREVDDAECRGESAGVTAAEDSESVAEAVAEVAVRRSTGCLGRAVAEAMMLVLSTKD